MDELDRIKQKKKLRKSYTNIPKKKHNYIYNFITRLLIVTIITLILLIFLKRNKDFKNSFYKEIYEKNFSFTKINNLYQKYLGSFLPFENILKNETVFNEKLSYENANKYLDGVSLKVKDKYLVPSLQSGLVVFIGDKENYGNTIIIQGVDGIDIWYSNIENTNIKLYDYISKGSLVGNTKDTNLYLVFKKDGNILEYEKYL